jgi:hypothetical protein
MNMAIKTITMIRMMTLDDGAVDKKKNQNDDDDANL